MTTRDLTGTAASREVNAPSVDVRRWLPRPNQLRENLVGYLFVFPAIFLIFVFGVFPIGYALYMSVHRWGLQRTTAFCEQDQSTIVTTLSGCLRHYQESAIGSWNGLLVTVIGFTALFFVYWFWVNAFGKKRRTVGSFIFWQIVLAILALALVVAGLNGAWNPAVMLVLSLVILAGGFWFWTNHIDLQEPAPPPAIARALAVFTLGIGALVGVWALIAGLSILSGVLLFGQNFSLNTTAIIGMMILLLIGAYLMANADNDDVRDAELTATLRRIFRVGLRIIGVVVMAQAAIGAGIPFAGLLFGSEMTWAQALIGILILIAGLGAVGMAFNVYVLGDAFENGQGVVLRGFVFLLILTFVGGMIAWGSVVIDTFARSFETVMAPVNWPSVGLIFVGVLLIVGAYRFWTTAFQPGTRQAYARFMVALALLALSIAVISYGWNQMFGTLTRRNQDFLRGLEITVYYAFGSIPLQLLLGLLLAYVLFQNIKGKETFRMIFFLPYVTPAVASAVVFGRIFRGDNLGLVNTFLDSLGVPVQRWVQQPEPFLNVIFGWELEGFIAGPSMALISVIILGIWTYTGYNAVIFLAGLGGIPNDLYEAAKVDGASQWHLFRFITLPLLSPITFYLSLLGFIGTFQAFNTLFVIRSPAAQRTLDTAGLVIYDTFNDIKRGEAAAQAIILFIVILILTQLQRNVFEKRVFYG